MHLYAVVWIDEVDCLFQEDPEWFDFLDDAISYRDRKKMKHPDRIYVILSCTEVD